MNLSKFIVIISLVFLSASLLNAEELRYKPINPAFGGNPFNGSYLLSNAGAQKQHDPPEKKRDPVEEFSERIQSGILSIVSRQIVQEILGDEAKDSGTFTVGDTIIDFQREGSDVVIELTDADGSNTSIKVPVPSN